LQSTGRSAAKEKELAAGRNNANLIDLSRKPASLQKQTLSPYSLVGVTGTFEQGFAMVGNRIPSAWNRTPIEKLLMKLITKD